MQPRTAEETVKATLPYIPEPFPDELFGSWLSRLVSLNAESSLASFAQTYKLKANIKSPLADPLNGANYVFALSNLLGFDYEDLVRTFTTKPYWDTFKLIELKDPSTSSFHGRRRSLPTLRVCPACVEHDTQNLGCPYFHRAHQLQSKACSVHGLALQDSCGRCGAPFRSSFMEVTLIPARCGCGAEIIPNLVREPANELWTDLAIFASKALVASPGELDLRHLVPYIFSFVESEVDISRATIMRNILSASYGVDGLDWLYWRRSTQTIKQSPIEQAHWTKNLEPHIAVAILVANGITFDNAKQEVAYQKSLPLTKRRQVSKDRTASKDGRPSTVIEARQIAENFGHQHKQRSALRAVKTYAYWLLYFQDREWLWNWAHDRDMRSAPKWIEPPGINADRVTIRGTSSAFKQHMARARAYARDREWLDDYKKTLRPQKKCRDNKILGALSAVRVQHFAEKSRPIKWTVTLAARRLRIPIPTLNKFIRRNKILGELIPESPHDFRSRLIEWGITECIRQGRKLTASQVQRAALLPGQTPYHIIEAAIERRLRT